MVIFYSHVRLTQTRETFLTRQFELIVKCHAVLRRGIGLPFFVESYPLIAPWVAPLPRRHSEIFDICFERNLTAPTVCGSDTGFAR